LGTVFTHCQLPDKALPHFQHACQLVPDSPLFIFNLASAQRMLGIISDADVNLDRAIRLAPGDGAAYLARTQLRRQTREKNHIHELKSALGRAPSAEAQVSIGYALAKELQDLGQYQSSFSYLSAASRLQRSRLKYDPASDIRLMRELGNLEYASAFRRESDSPQHRVRPIFVMGLPRSGTNLVDRIIASVPGVRSAAEVNVLAGLVWREATRDGRPSDPVGKVADTVCTSADQIGVEYMRSLEHQFDGPFIDKTPGNFLFAGLISSGLAEARVVCLRRNPLDSCYAIYKTLFSAAYPFTYELRELADYCVEWYQLIQRWERVLEDAWLTVEYEDLIRQPETTMRRIVSHCRLPWNAACLRFHELDAPVASASAGQVSRPLHRDSIGL
jgi:tetratricopeptide (TPR) repeat protein